MDTRKMMTTFMLCLLFSCCTKSETSLPQSLDLGMMHEGATKPERFYIAIGVDSPPYQLQSCLEAPEYFGLSFSGWLGGNNMNTTAYYSEIIRAVSLLTWPAKTSISFALKIEEDLQSAKMIPSSTLASDADYLIRIEEVSLVQKVGLIKPEREYTFFRVGSMPRVAEIDFRSAKTNSTELELFGVMLSEPVDVAKFVSALSVTDLTNDTVLPLTLLTANSSAWNIGFNPPKGTLVSTKLRFTIGTDVGDPSGLLLDGKYTGKSGSGGLTVDLTPSDYIIKTDFGGSWVPDLAF
jgi:hypothetical protein